MNIRYAGDSSERQLLYLLNKLTLACQKCTMKKMYICIEECCSKSDPFVCLECDSEHMLHRKNQLRLLFLDYSHIEPMTIIINRKKKELSSFLHQQIKRNQQLVERQLVLVSLYKHSLAELDKIAFSDEELWLQKGFQLIKRHVFKPLIDKKVQIQFYQHLKSINLYLQDPIPKIQQINILKKQLAEYTENPLKFIKQSNKVTVFERIKQISQKKQKFVEELILKTNLERYQEHNPTQFQSIITNTINRSKNFGTKLVKKQQSQAIRIMVSHSTEKPLRTFGDQVLELHTISHIQKLPNHLQSLSYNAWGYDPLEKNKHLKDFPVTIKILRIHQAVFPKTRIPYNLSHLVNVKYLTIVDFAFSKKELKSIIQFSMKNQCRVLCLLKGPLRQNYANVSNYMSKIETCYTHIYPSLQMQYLIYKRKLLQITFMARTKFIRKSYWSEHILNFASCNLEEM